MNQLEQTHCSGGWFSFDLSFVFHIHTDLIDEHQENVGAWSKVVLNASGPPTGVVVPVVHLVHSDPF